MSKLIVNDNVRIVIPVAGNVYSKTAEEAFNSAMSDARTMVAEIKRHVDGASGGRYDSSPEIEYDTHCLCSFCDNEWESEDTGEPVCCEAAAEEWRAEQSAPHGSPEEESRG